MESCKQLDLLTGIRPCKKLKVNAEDSKMLLKESLQKHETKTQLGVGGQGFTE